MNRFVVFALVCALFAGALAENYGNQTTNIGADVAVTFTENGTFRMPSAGRVRLLLVGGGGAGGSNGSNSQGVNVSCGGKGGDGVVILRWRDNRGFIVLAR